MVEALAGISEAELDAQHDGWTAREVAHHLANSEMTAAIRLRRVLAEDRPVIGGYDEETFARVLKYAAEDWLQIYAAHGHDHAQQIRRARARVP